MRFKDARVGDKVYSRICGGGTINKVDGKDSFIFVSFSTCFKWYRIDGREYSGSVEPMLFYRDDTSNYLEERPVQKVPWDKVPVDTKVVVDNNGGSYNRHFRGLEDKFFWCFDDGKTSWTAPNPATSWKNYKLGEDIEIDGVLYKAGSR